jgi:hypothetical protein
MASRRQRKRKKKRVKELPASARPQGQSSREANSQARPTPVHAIELKHTELARMLAGRADRFSQVLANVMEDERHGQYLVTRRNLSDQEFEELESLAEEAHDGFRTELADAIDELRRMLGEGDPLYITVVVQMANLMTGWGTYYEPTHRGRENSVELVAGLIATQPPAAQLAQPSSETMQRIFDELDQIQDLVLLFNLSMPRGDDPTIARLRFTGALRWMLLRGSSYHHHGQELARAVYTQHDDWLVQNYGFTVDDVLAVGSTVDALTMGRINELPAPAVEFADAIMDELETARVRGDMPVEIEQQLATEGAADRVRLAAMFDHFARHVRDAGTFSVDELCEFNPDLHRPRVEALLRELSISVGELASTEYTGLFDESPLVERPFLEFGGRYVLVVHGMVLRDPLQLLEARLQAKPNFFVTRARTLDALAVQYLADMLPDSTPYTQLYYEGAELDGLVLFEDIAFVVEGKGTPLSVAASRGDVQRLVRDINRAVQEAWEQGARARTFILSGRDAVFTDEHRAEVLTLPAGAVRDVHIVNPTIHELGGHATQLGRLRALGLFPDDELPWSVFINDLRVISETCDNAAVFLHYLEWRRRLPLGDRVDASDELDLWGSYLNCERFGMLAGEGPVVTIGNSATDFDAYYAGVLGEGPATPRPGKFLVEPVKSFISRMATERSPGWREASGALLDLSLPELAFVHATAAETALAAKREGAPTWSQAGRVLIIGVPREGDVEITPIPDDDEITIVLFCRSVTNRRAEIVWARYERPVTFALSSFEEAAAVAAGDIAFPDEDE